MDNTAVILFVIAIVCLVFLCIIGVLTYFAQRKLYKNMAGNKFSLSAIYEVSNASKERFFSLKVSNRGVNDATVSAIGVVSGLKYYNLENEYRKQSGLIKDKIVICCKADISVKISVAGLEKLLFSNFEKSKMEKIKLYVLDSSGNVFLSDAKELQKVLKADYVAIMKQGKEEEKAAKAGKDIKPLSLSEKIENLLNEKTAKAISVDFSETVKEPEKEDINKEESEVSSENE